MPSVIDDWTDANDVAEAELRHSYWVERDPFPDIPPALLGSDAVLEYIRVTAMVHPFRGWQPGIGGQQGEPDRKLVKPASYEIRPGKAFYYFDEKGDLVKNDLTVSDARRMLRLPRNSITFVSTEETLRLPNYIAARFNLRIKHVHRGILLGTGPLVDPGFNLPILIPLHNLTDQDYFISLDEGLIWVEFTKTYPAPADIHWGKVAKPGLPRTTKKGFEEFIDAASNGTAIRSSISEAVVNAREAADESARKIAGFETRINAIGIVGIIALVITVASLLLPTLDLIRTSDDRLQQTRDEIGQMRQELNELKAERDRAGQSTKEGQNKR